MLCTAANFGVRVTSWFVAIVAGCRVLGFRFEAGFRAYLGFEAGQGFEAGSKGNKMGRPLEQMS